MPTIRPTHLLFGLGYASALASGGFADDEGAYRYPFQHRVGDRATFNVSGPATGDGPDVEGDATLNSVIYPSGDEFIFFYKPVAVHDIQYSGPLNDWRVRGGVRTTYGVSGDFVYGAADGNASDVSASDVEDFRGRMFSAFQNNNLNNYVDLTSSSPRFSFIIEFNLVVMDNDPDPDDFGEILYFERGAGAGNSWLKIQAVDESGDALGPWLVIQPQETVQTTPVTTVMRRDQTVGTSSIDVSRLGVTEFRYLRISNDVPGESAYSGGGDLAPDFKIMAVMTNEEQLAEMMIYD